MKLSDFKNEQQYPDDWPPYEYYSHEASLESAVVAELRTLVEGNAGERELLDAFISTHPILLTAVLDFQNTGHHAAWVVPKKTIRSKVSKAIPGLIPDFLVGGRNSFGITWYVIELKGAGHDLFNRSGNTLSPAGNRGLCQVLGYLQYCDTAQSHLRDGLKLYGFGSAKAFLFIGRENETQSQRACDPKAAFNIISDRLQIRSYDALLRSCNRILGSYRVGGGLQH